MRCPPEVAAIIGSILSTGLLRIRAQAWNQNAERCAVEADHLHNLPALLTDFRPELLEYYWRVERVAFTQQSTPEEFTEFEPLWNALAEFIAKEVATHIA
jgi:hypothetical protein